MRDALLLALLPRPTPALPDPAALDAAAFWPRFDAAAPLALRVAVTLAAGLVVGVAPWLLHGRAWGRLTPDEHDGVLQRLAAWPGVADLLDVAKLVACFRYFDDDGVQAALRGPSR
jgi:hypothetical protein